MKSETNEIEQQIQDIREHNENKFLSLAKYTGGLTRYNRDYFVRLVKDNAAHAIHNMIEMAKAYYVLRTMETDESFGDICEVRMGVSRRTGYRWAKVGEAFGGYTVQQMKDLGTAEVSKLQILASAPSEEIHHLLTDGNFYGEDKDEILKMSRRELSEFMAKQRYQENYIETLKQESREKSIKLREKEIELKDVRGELDSLREGDAAKQMPEELKRFAELFDAAKFTLTKLYNYMNDNHKTVTKDPDVKDYLDGHFSQLTVRFDNIQTFIRERILFPNGEFPRYEVPGLEEDRN